MEKNRHKIVFISILLIGFITIVSVILGILYDIFPIHNEGVDERDYIFFDDPVITPNTAGNNSSWDAVLVINKIILIDEKIKWDDIEIIIRMEAPSSNLRKIILKPNDYNAMNNETDSEVNVWYNKINEVSIHVSVGDSLIITGMTEEDHVKIIEPVYLDGNNYRIGRVDLPEYL